MPTPNELTVLRTATELGAVTKRKISREMGINTEYAGYLLESLFKKGFLSAISPGKFELTARGEDALLFQLHHIKGILAARANGTIRQIEKIDERIHDYEDYVKSRMSQGLRNRQEM